MRLLFLYESIDPFGEKDTFVKSSKFYINLDKVEGIRILNYKRGYCVVQFIVGNKCYFSENLETMEKAEKWLADWDL